MAQFLIYAMACKFEKWSHGTTLSYKPFDGKLASEVIEAKSCADIDAAMATMRDAVSKTHAGSFFVSQTLRRGARAPSGYRQRSFKVEVDRDTQPAAVAS